MKNFQHIINATLAAAIGALGFGGCRTPKQVANDPEQPNPPVIIEHPGKHEPRALVYGPPPTPYNRQLGNTIHIVENGETLMAIARQYGVTVADIIRWNGLTSMTLTPGMRLKISSNHEVTPTDSTAVPDYEEPRPKVYGPPPTRFRNDL